MLVLTRLVSESILISDDIRITVLKCGNGSVSLGIEAPREVVVLREELAADIEPPPETFTQKLRATLRRKCG